MQDMSVPLLHTLAPISNSVQMAEKKHNYVQLTDTFTRTIMRMTLPLLYYIYQKLI